MEKIYGYVRVSSADQNEERQMAAMRGKNIPKNRVYIDKSRARILTDPSIKR